VASMISLSTILLIGHLAFVVQGQSSSSSCSTTISNSYPAPSVASGWEARLITKDIKAPRGIIFDSEGHLLVVSKSFGIVNLELKDNGGTCITVAKQTTLIESPDVSEIGSIDSIFVVLS
jgi:hypothetical protein